MYILSQVLAFISLILNVFSRGFKKQSHSILVNMVSNIFGLLSCLLLFAYMGMAGLIVSTIRSIVFYIYSKNNWDKKLWLLLLFIGLQLGVCIFTSAVSGFVLIDFVLIMLKSSLFAFGCWQHNVKVFRISSILSCIMAIIYYMLYAGYINAVSELLSIILLVIVMIKEYYNKKVEVKNISSNSNLIQEDESFASEINE